MSYSSSILQGTREGQPATENLVLTPASFAKRQYAGYLWAALLFVTVTYIASYVKTPTTTQVAGFSNAVGAAVEAQGVLGLPDCKYVTFWGGDERRGSSYSGPYDEGYITWTKATLESRYAYARGCEMQGR